MKQKKMVCLSSKHMKARTVGPIVSMVVIAAILVGIYLHFSWNGYSRMAKAEALQLAQSVEALLHAEHIEALALGDSPQALSEAASVEQSLVRLVEENDSIYYAYILKRQNGNFVVMADSSAADSTTSNPTKRSYEETAEINQLPFETGQSLLTKPISLPGGNWIRALVPVKSPESGDSIAVLGLSYSAAEWQANLWKEMAPNLVIAACLLVIMFTFLYLRYEHLKLKKTTANLKFQEAIYRNIVDKAPIGILLHGNKENQGDGKYLSVNPKGEAILGRSLSELQKIVWQGITVAEDLDVEIPLFDRFIKGEISSYSMEKRVIRPDGSTVWVNFHIVNFPDSSFSEPMYLCLLEDISERKRSEELIRESERSKAVFFAHLPGMAYRCKNDPSWTMEFVSEGCQTLTGYTAEALIANREISYNEIISHEYRKCIRSEWERILMKREHYRGEYEIITKSGERKWVLELSQGVFDAEGNVEALEGIVLDISDRKKKDHQIAYLSEHDSLTGLFNRNYVEQEKIRLDKPESLPLSIAICDIDGLRMVNDAYGYEEGDHLIAKTAKLIQGCLNGQYVLSHSGGGEFVLLLPHTDSTTAHQLKISIKNTIESYNRANEDEPYAISVSIGHSTKETENQQIQDVAKAADEHLHNSKLLNQNSAHSAVISSIMATLYAKSQETEAHGQRIGRFCRIIGRQLGLAPKELDDLQLLSKLHDIGKIGIDDSILNKPGKLSVEEWKIMKQHPEIGRRIAMSTPQLEHIADYILHHHERWDGTGYPIGLKEQEIPIVARILAIADAFDAMTADRIYRKAMPYESAIRELEQNAGTQFDPEITRLFIARMAMYHKEEKS